MAALNPNDSSIVANLQSWLRPEDQLGDYSPDEAITTLILHTDSSVGTTVTVNAGAWNWRIGTGPNSSSYAECTTAGSIFFDTGATATAGYTMIAVTRSPSTSTGRQHIIGEEDNGTKKGWYQPGNDGSTPNYQFYDEGEATWLVCSKNVTNSPATNEFVMGIISRNGSSDEIACFHSDLNDGYQDITLDTPLVRGEDLDVNLIGGDNGGGTSLSVAGFGIVELIIYDKELSQAEREGVHDYLAAKYGFISISAVSSGGGGSFLAMGMFGV